MLATNSECKFTNWCSQVFIPFPLFSWLVHWVGFQILGIGHVVGNIRTCKLLQGICKQRRDQLHCAGLRWIICWFLCHLMAGPTRRGQLSCSNLYWLIMYCCCLNSMICRFRGYHKKLFLLHSLQLPAMLTWIIIKIVLLGIFQVLRYPWLWSFLSNLPSS